MEKLNSRLFFSKEIWIVLLIILTTPWTWKIIHYNFFLFLILMLISVVLVKLLVINKLQIILICFLAGGLLIASVISLQIGFDRELNRLNFNNEIQINGRHNYYARELGAVFLNRYVLNYYKNYKPAVDKFERNFFSVLDPNLYFFASHPRERPGINEFNKYPPVYLFLFLLGIFNILKKRTLIILFPYLLAASFVSGFISSAFVLGPVLLFPFISTVISLGLIDLLDSLREKIAK